ncbi:MAG: ABC transporter ATP-binding protein [Opitutales bacterium]
MGTLRVQDLELKLNQSVILQNVDLEASAGALTVISGLSESGKTSLLRSIAGFEKPQRGAVVLDGKDVSQLSPSQRSISLLNQKNALFTHLSVAKNVAMALRGEDLNDAETAQNVSWILDALGMSEVADRKPHQLTGSQHQLAALARSILARSTCLLLDEPLTSLDRVQKQALFNLIREVSREREISVLLATQDLESCLPYADSVAVLSDGRIVQSGAPDEIYRRPLSVEVARQFPAFNILEGKIILAEAGMLLVSTQLGDLAGVPVNADAEFSPDECVDIAIRPESLHCDLMAPEENAFAVTIQEAGYFGYHADLKVLANELSLTVRIPNPQSRQPYLMDSEMFAWVDSDDVVVMKR